MNNRIVFIDVARSFAILLALTDHSMNDFHVWTSYEFSKFAIIKAITSSATPTFLFIFGMMIEVVYLKRLNQKGLKDLVPRLVKRSYQCYRGYGLTALAGFIGGVLTFNTMIAAMIFVGKTHYGNILKLYTFYMFLAIPILFIRKKLGIYKLLMIVLSFWIIYPLLQLIQIDNYHISVFTSTFFGFGGLEGPSILYSSTIVVLGMFSASFISLEKKFQFLKVNIIGITIIGGLILSFIFYGGANEFEENYFNNGYRYHSHPVYYLCGTFLALVFTTLFSILFPIGSYLKNGIKPFLILGQESLSAFTWGNVILNLIALKVANYSWNELAPMSFVIFMILFLHLKKKLESNKMLSFSPIVNINNGWNDKVLIPISNKIITVFSKNP